MLTHDDLEARRELMAADPVLGALAGTVRRRVERVLREAPTIPELKALLSRDGGICPTDGSTLAFDPWSPSAHRCPRCGTAVTGPRHDGHWARTQHLWVAERTLDLAVLAVLDGDEAAGRRAVELLDRHAAVYQALPNRDNVLGPTRLFFSTYLESMWVTTWAGAAFLLREAGQLPDERHEAVDRVLDEAATLIGEFNEGLSNRQVWHAAALTAIASWFGDAELGQTAVESRTGLLGLLADGFDADDGMWWEGENYHLFALRGMMTGLQWARTAGIDLLEDPELRRHFSAALLAPSRTALPDLTYPARKDSRYGVSLAQPAFLELWEIGRAWLGAEAGLDAWLAALYRRPADPMDHYDAWLHDVGFAPPVSRDRHDLSAWALLAMDPAPLAPAAAWSGESGLVASQGLAVLREGDRYVSLECGAAGGGHGHPDRLHLTLHGGGVHWLPDMGTGSYVDASLAWYRSPRAHNAPSLGGESPPRAHCEAFDVKNGWAWARGRAGDLVRTVVSGDGLVVDVVEFTGRTAELLELPWHLQGGFEVRSPGAWEPVSVDGLDQPERFHPGAPGPIVVEARSGESRLRVHFLGGAELLRAQGPGLPRRAERMPYLLQRTTGTSARLVTVMELVPADAATVQSGAEEVTVERAGARVTLRRGAAGLSIAGPAGRTDLAGLRPAPTAVEPLFRERPTWDAQAVAVQSWEHPALDGTLEGFDPGQPVVLDTEAQYRRSEEPYDPERFSVTAYLNWDVEALYVAIVVQKPDRVVRPLDAPPLNLDNDPDDIHQDGVQLYLRWPDGRLASWLLIPGEEGLRVRALTEAGTTLTGTWAATEDGYCLTVALADSSLASLAPGTRLGFDLLVNEMGPDRVRRLGQLVWSGGGGWVYLRGDRHNVEHLGELTLE